MNMSKQYHKNKPAINNCYNGAYKYLIVSLGRNDSIATISMRCVWGKSYSEAFQDWRNSKTQELESYSIKYDLSGFDIKEKINKSEDEEYRKYLSEKYKRELEICEQELLKYESSLKIVYVDMKSTESCHICIGFDLCFVIFKDTQETRDNLKIIFKEEI